ncbi:hypothetical protein cypCar_00047220, partial [Cyprinus carpio]
SRGLLSETLKAEVESRLPSTFSCEHRAAQSSLCVMEVLRPALINISGRVYRKNPVQEESYEEEEDDYPCSGAAAEQCLDEPCDAYDIQQTDRGFRCAIDVPSVLYKLVHES